jgi:hypothetical protein
MVLCPLFRENAPFLFGAGGRVRSIKLFLTVSWLIFTVSCSSHGVRGSGNVVSESRPVSGFSSVKLKGTGQVMIEENGSESLTVTADDNLMSYLTTEVNGNQLVLGTKDNTNLNPSRDIIYKLAVKDLNAIEMGGVGSIEAKGIHTDRLKVVLGGSGSISTSGTADEQEITLAGQGDYRGKDLTSKTATINIMGNGDAVLNTSQKLDANIMGSGSIKYIGDPVVTQHILGSGSIQKQ